MHSDPFSHRNERRAEPSDRAKAARDRWLASMGGEEAAKRRMIGPLLPHNPALDRYVTGMRDLMVSEGLKRLHQATVNERLRELRRIRRNLRLALTLCVLASAAALALVVYYGILGHH